MITFDGSAFLLRNENLSCLLRLRRTGQVEQLHLGRPVRAGDAEALAPKQSAGWGATVVYEENDPTSGPDTWPLAWSGSGRGDYRESPLELSRAGHAIPTDFVYAGHEIRRGTVPMSDLPQAEGDCESLVLKMEHRGGRLQLMLIFSLFETALVRRSVLTNTGAEPLVLRKLMSLMMDLPGRWEMHTFDGGWSAETHRNSTPVGEARVVNESVTGSSSNRHNPGFLLARPGAGEDYGTVIGINLVYSGNHYSSAQRSLHGLTRVMSGISPDSFAWELMPGEAFEAPEAVIACSEEGFNGLRRQMHRFVAEHVTPAAWRSRPRPVLCNSWEGCTFDFDEARIWKLALRAQSLGCELFVLDDGWFGARNDDHAGLGDYTVNRAKLPNGLDGLADSLGAMGLTFGLWFEPEAVNPDSKLYRAHPDWAIHQEGLPDLLERHELLLDLRKPEVRDYIVASVCGILDSTEIAYVKWDMNRRSPLLGAEAHAYILGLYEVLRRIFGPRSHILLESCSSGGNRFDLGMLRFSPQVWASDDTDPIERLDIQGGLSYLYPLSAIGAHVSAAPHGATLRDTPFATRGNVSFFGLLGYELDLEKLLPAEEEELREQIAFYKAHRSVFQYGEFRRIETGGEAECWQVSDGTTTIVGLFQRLSHAVPGYDRLRAEGLDPEKTYRITARRQSVFLGGEKLPEAPAERYVASGAALMAGIGLRQRYTGAGVRPDMRLPGDFSSSVYLIEERPAE